METGELRPGRNQIGGYPVDFLWATTNIQGDRTASAFMQGYRDGMTALVRLTLHAGDFELWPTIIDRFPQWTAEHVRRLEATARNRGETNFSRWRARAETLPLSRIVCVEAKTYVGAWKTVNLHDARLRHRNDPTARGVLLNGNVYFSIQRIRPGHATGYGTGKVLLDEWRRSAA